MQNAELKTLDFRLYLQQELVDKCKANPKYSLRAFARRLKIEPSFLSKVLAGKRAVTPTLISRLAPYLELSPTDLEKFTSPKQDISFQQLTIDTFQMISDWYHYAILELMTVEGFENSPKWIAGKLGIKPAEAQAAVERLLRLEMLSLDEEGNLVNTSGNHTTVGNEFTAIAFRKLQKQILDQSKVALEEVPIEFRDQSSMTMAISSSLLPEAKKMLKDFRRNFCSDLQKRDISRDEVYQLSMSFFPVTKLNKNAGAAE